ncbi:MAG: DivIVA domain-containing protein [Nitrospina sp.]|nr:DivIVA domain-containing protein [Nitrospina sp.]
MRLNHLDILEQCFRDKFFGYNKEDVDSFMHLVADDFKEMSNEIDRLKKQVDRNNLTTNIKNEENHKSKITKNDAAGITPEAIKEKAKKIINAAREHADQHKKKAAHELSALKREIDKLKEEKRNLAETPKQ